jgi:hypothetical protein
MELEPAQFLLDLDDDIALEEWKAIFEVGDPAQMPDLLPFLVYEPEVRADVKEEALNHVRSTWRWANTHRMRRKLRPLAPLPEMRVAIPVTLCMDAEGHYIKGQQ